MRLLMMGTGPFAVPTFEHLLHSRHDVLGLVTRSPVQGRRRSLSANPMREIASGAGLPIWDPPDINQLEAVEQLRECAADLLVVCDYGQILSAECLAVSRLGGINLHGSLLPKYRGAAPIQWAIYQGESVLGVSVIHLTPRLDQGPILSQVELEITPEETAADVEPRLAQVGVACVMDAIEQLEAWDGQRPIGQVQDDRLATRAPRLKKQDGLIYWNRSAQQIVNQIRAFQPWPGSYTHWAKPGSDNPPLRLILHRAVAHPSPTGQSPGRVVQADPSALIIAAGNSALQLLELQPAGKRTMQVDEFLRGNPLQVGNRLG